MQFSGPKGIYVREQEYLLPFKRRNLGQWGLYQSIPDFEAFAHSFKRVFHKSEKYILSIYIYIYIDLMTMSLWYDVGHSKFLLLFLAIRKIYIKVLLATYPTTNAKSLACDTANEHALTCTRETCSCSQTAVQWNQWRWSIHMYSNGREHYSDS